MPSSSHQTTITVVACRKVFTGRDANQRTFNIYEVDARNKQGQIIAQQLRSFEEFSVGEVIDVTVTPFESETHGKSYTVHRIQKEQQEVSQETQELLGMLHTLGETVTVMGGRLVALEKTVESMIARMPL